MRAVDGVSLSVDRGKTLGIVGESGSGKSVTAQTIMGLTRVPDTRPSRDGSRFDGRDLARDCSADELREHPRHAIAMIFQDPLSSLHPFYQVGDQIVEAIRVHRARVDATGAPARDRAARRSVGIPRPARALRRLPARVLRRHAPARDDRDGARATSPSSSSPTSRRRRSTSPSRRRSSSCIAQLQRRARHGRHPHHPRPRRRRRDGGRGRRDVRRPRCVEHAPARGRSSGRREHPYTWGLLQLDPAARRARATERSMPIPGAPPSLITLPGGLRVPPALPVRAQPSRVRDRTRRSRPGARRSHAGLPACPDERARRRLWAELTRRDRAARYAVARTETVVHEEVARAEPRRGSCSRQDLVKHFPIRKGSCSSAGGARARGRRHLASTCRRARRSASSARPAAASRTHGAAASPGCSSRRAARSASTARTSPRSPQRSSSRCAATIADDLPGPVRVAQPAQTVGSIIGEPLRVHGVKAGAGRARRACRS